ncbi:MULTISPECIES: tripartite tricarboxylate transporter substrate binding protein [unclassified Halomonas]|uniref:tripartite tricarboxylate transporter substrate binding protein n=1 Tax=unclassified Halomonas TaxID=2609666 RepID=UPI002076683A|nr:MULTISPECIES: tripartite tricarboxylate transporter substrate binding protein [unclassified Halomonas]
MIKTIGKTFLGSIAATMTIATLPALFVSTAHADDDSIRIIVPYTAGGSYDAYARTLATGMSESLDRQVLVENKPGGNGIIAATYVANADPDGTTLLMGGTGPISLNIMLRPALPYSFDSFEPVSLLFSGPMSITVPTVAGIESIDELVEYANASNSPIRYGTMGPGSATDLYGRLLMEELGIEGVGVAYNGMPASIIDLIAGQAELTFSAPQGIQEYEKSGEVKMLALSTSERDERFPDTPSVVELGYPELVLSYWGGFLAPSGTPQDVVDELAEAAVEAAHSEEFATLIENQGNNLSAEGSEGMANQLETDRQTWGSIIETNNIVLN